MIMSLRSKPPAGVNPVMPIFAPETSGSARKPTSPLHGLALRSNLLRRSSVETRHAASPRVSIRGLHSVQRRACGKAEVAQES
jgi:hypothetical protein